MAKGIVRKIDELGRVVLPKEYRRTFGIKDGDPLGMLVDEGTVYLFQPPEGFKGIIRDLDDLGRYTVPIEARRSLGLCEGQAVDVYVDKLKSTQMDAICIRKVGCFICGSPDGLIEVDGCQICGSCAKKIRAALERSVEV